ncbi:hypothetical protein ACHAXT_003008 [Thalassiosira profunda]
MHALMAHKEEINCSCSAPESTMAARIDRSASSGAKRTAAAGARAMDISSDAPSGKAVDAARNPTELFRRIKGGDWEGALAALHDKPTDARVWISRRAKGGEGVPWKYLPLHLICLQRRPPIDLLEALLQCYPEAASMPTPHDGNLPMHFICEGGCEDPRVFAALLASHPPSLEATNSKGKTPLLVCHAKSRGVLMKVLRERRPMPFGEGKKKQAKRGKKKSKKAVERRDDIDASWPRSKSSEERQPPHRHRPKTTPARLSGSPGEGSWDDMITPRVSNGRVKKKDQGPTAKKETVETAPFFTSTSASSSADGDTDTDAGSFISSKTTEFARAALNYLYPSYEDEPQQQPEPPADNTDLEERVQSLTQENAAQKQTIEELTKKLEQATSPKEEVSVENSQLCERILAKAEADSVAFRTEIQKLHQEKERMRRLAEAKEKKQQAHLGRVRKLLLEKGCQMKPEASNDDLFECTKTMLEALEGSLTKSEVALKKLEAKNALLKGERDSLSKSHCELERRVALLEEEKTVAQKGMSELKDKTTTLTVINENLKEQLEGSPKDPAVQAAKDKAEQQISELEANVDSLLTKNRLLKETILRNNDQHSKTVADLGEKFASLEKVNIELRQSVARRAMDGRSKSDLRVHLDAEEKLLYEV